MVFSIETYCPWCNSFVVYVIIYYVSNCSQAYLAHSVIKTRDLYPVNRTNTVPFCTSTTQEIHISCASPILFPFAHRPHKRSISHAHLQYRSLLHIDHTRDPYLMGISNIVPFCTSLVLQERSLSSVTSVSLPVSSPLTWSSISSHTVVISRTSAKSAPSSSRGQPDCVTTWGRTQERSLTFVKCVARGSPFRRDSSLTRYCT